MRAEGEKRHGLDKGLFFKKKKIFIHIHISVYIYIYMLVVCKVVVLIKQIDLFIKKLK